jgi:hypothetical protein
MEWLKSLDTVPPAKRSRMERLKEIRQKGGMGTLEKIVQRIVNIMLNTYDPQINVTGADVLALKTSRNCEDREVFSRGLLVSDRVMEDDEYCIFLDGIINEVIAGLVSLLKDPHCRNDVEMPLIPIVKIRPANVEITFTYMKIKVSHKIPVPNHIQLLQLWEKHKDAFIVNKGEKKFDACFKFDNLARPITVALASNPYLIVRDIGMFTVTSHDILLCLLLLLFQGNYVTR